LTEPLARFFQIREQAQRQTTQQFLIQALDVGGIKLMEAVVAEVHRLGAARERWRWIRYWPL